MKFKTLRNLLASMLVLGVAASVIMAGNGTFALFNATTTNPNNVFSTDDLTFVNTPTGGACTATSSGQTTPANAGNTTIATALGGGACTAIASLQNMIPGDSTVGSFTLNNGSSTTGRPADGSPAFTLGFAVAKDSSLAAVPIFDNATSMTANGQTDGSQAGLGLLIFSCRNASGPVACASATKLAVLYGSCTGGPDVTGTTTTTAVQTLALTSGFSKTQLASASTTGVTLPVTGATGTNNCTAGNTSTGIGAIGATTNTGTLVTIDGPDAVPSTLGYKAATTDFLAAVFYLPGTSGNAMANNNSAFLKGLNFTWVATQVVGVPR